MDLEDTTNIAQYEIQQSVKLLPGTIRPAVVYVGQLLQEIFKFTYYWWVQYLAKNGLFAKIAKLNTRKQ